MHGTCARGEGCPFSHDRSDVPNTVCTHWLRGFCAYGDKCRYDHVHPEWNKREERVAAGYEAPAVPKPAADALEAQKPVSQLRLGGALGTKKPPMPPGSAALQQGLPKRSPPRPAPPRRAHDAMEAALPDDLDLLGDALQTKLHVDAEALAAADAAAEAAEAARAAAALEYADSGAAASEGHYYEGFGGVEGVAGGGEGEGDLGGYYGEEEQYDAAPYYSGSHYGGSAYGSYNGTHSSAGEHGPHGSAGTSPGMAGPAWAVPGASGPGSEEGVGWGAPDPSRFYASPALQSLCWEHYNTGVCSAGEACPAAHGDYCDACGHCALHPTDAAARDAHVAECRARADRLDALRRSAHVECGICMEQVVEKPPPADRRFGLLACDHAFCLSCIRQWRQQYAGGADVDAALRTCPLCRVPTHFITPSMVWPGTPEDKEAIVAGYRAKLGEIDCKHFAFGEGACPFGSSCMYRHAYRDGRREEAAPRRVAADEGEVHVVQPVRLSDFIVVQRGRVRGRRR